MYWIAKLAGPSRRPRIIQSNSIDQWPRFSRPMAIEFSTCLGIVKCREEMQSEVEEELSPLVGPLVSHWENESLGRKGRVGREKNQKSHANGIRKTLNCLRNHLEFGDLR
ncbi:hypothetical protein TNCV_3435601 [Trichonephila clavipes]|nr:hypothetical protein TNCV_3435601 [Trichonephila clavipes]